MNINRLSSLVFLIFLVQLQTQAHANDTLYIKVHFLYGSKPKREFKDIESKWFGGKLGGHVGIEIDSNRVLNFVPQQKTHYFSHKKKRNSKFAIHSNEDFWDFFRTSSDSVKRMSINIPITSLQKQKLDSLAHMYQRTTPYDYAFFGMRCGAATYEILGQMGILKEYGYRLTFWKIFYPRRLRKRLIFIANQENWNISKSLGSYLRKWERD